LIPQIPAIWIEIRTTMDLFCAPVKLRRLPKSHGHTTQSIIVVKRCLDPVGIIIWFRPLPCTLSTSIRVFQTPRWYFKNRRKKYRPVRGGLSQIFSSTSFQVLPASIVNRSSCLPPSRPSLNTSLYFRLLVVLVTEFLVLSCRCSVCNGWSR
jgi:hypothetical protein